MAGMQRWPEREVAQVPAVWRSTLQGVLILDGHQLHQLEGLAAGVWLVLDDGPRSSGAVLDELRVWHTSVDPDELEQALDTLVARGLLRS